MKPGPRISLADLSDLLLVICFATVVIWYFFDTLGASRRIENMIFIVPVSAVAVVLCGIIIIQILRRILAARHEADATDTAIGTPAPEGSLLRRLRPGMVAGLFVVYVLSLERVGFDLATFLFVAATLAIQGERQPLIVIGYSFAFAAALTYGFRLLLPYPLETLIF